LFPVQSAVLPCVRFLLGAEWQPNAQHLVHAVARIERKIVLPNTSEMPVAVWHDLSASGYLVSDLGQITGTPTADLHHHRDCPGRSCAVLDQPLGRCLLFSTGLLAELDTGSGRYQNLYASRRGDFVDLSVDHVSAARTPLGWTYRLLPLRWRNTDPLDFVDPGLQLGVWPD
jgi:hypothetical protein